MQAYIIDGLRYASELEIMYSYIYVASYLAIYHIL